MNRVVTHLIREPIDATFAAAKARTKRPLPHLVAGAAGGSLAVVQSSRVREKGVTSPISAAVVSGGIGVGLLNIGIGSAYGSPLFRSVGQVIIGATLTGAAWGAFSSVLPMLPHLEIGLSQPAPADN